MIGVGGWRNRTEQAGPKGTSATARWSQTPRRVEPAATVVACPSRLTVRDSSHPIMKGLPPMWMHQGDELYAALRGPGKNMTVLATAHFDPSNAGTGHDEPQLMALRYGQGRVFHTTLGHDINGISSVDFVVTLQRGTEWAATGSVTRRFRPTSPPLTR